MPEPQSEGERPRGGGRLSVVATPIGNLDDITLRALATLRAADVILAEDTRHTRKLAAHHGIGTPLRAFHAHSSAAAVERAVAELREGKHLALVTDAGTPLVSDPGNELVCAARDAGAKVEAIPGASAVLSALSVCGLPFDAFRFCGFAPRSGGRRADWLERIARDPGAHVFFEAPSRLGETLAELAPLLAEDRVLAVCRELTKVHEEVVRGTAGELAARYAEGARGEITVVVGAGDLRAHAEPAAGPSRQERIEALLAQGMSPRDVARTLANELHVARREVYAEVQALLGVRDEKR